MASTSLAQPAHEPTTEPQPGYALRGLGLVELRGDEILGSYQGGGRYLVPSGTEVGRLYEVRVGVRRPSTCECRGFASHGHCSHVVAAERVASRSAVCDCCGIRAWWPQLTEVQEDDSLLAWFPGDRICDECRHTGHWA
jgi:hypothetical protein